MYRTLFCIAVLILVGAQAAVDTMCWSDSECEPDECCQILSEFIISSKRQMPSPPPPEPPMNSGTCQKKKVEGEGCNPYATLNGFCTCGSGLHCHLREEPLGTFRATVTSNKRGIPPPRPGYAWVSTCEK